VQDAAQIQNQISALIDDTDLQRMELALKVATNLVIAAPTVNHHKSITSKIIDST
jgi:hypothetical protein